MSATRLPLLTPVSDVMSCFNFALGMSIRKLVRDGLIVRKSFRIHARTRARLHKERVRKGRHCGTGKRRGTKEARMPVAV